MAAGYTGAETRIARVAVSSSPGQVQRVLDLLARLSAHASAPFERLLAIVARSVRPGTTVLVLTARDPRPFATRAAAARAGRAPTSSSSPCGAGAEREAARARSLGFTARRAVLDGPLAHRRAAGRIARVSAP